MEDFLRRHYCIFKCICEGRVMSCLRNEGVWEIRRVIFYRIFRAELFL